ncbi:MAG: hypothetical protein IT356_07815 [Gemmatimonadaceae bacterium]|nr:hypothetical protein [Gemmatimonadaceae bacterium]
MWLKALSILLIALAAGVLAVIYYGGVRWEARTRDLRARLDAARVPMSPRAFDYGEVKNLPGPVQRYFRTAIPDGQPIVAAVSMGHIGSFNMSESAEQWKPFSSTQRVVTRHPGFVWDGRIVILPGVIVRVHDAYVHGDGIMHATLLGLVSVADLHGTAQMAQGELMRFLAEAAWYPTALLPSQGVRWEAVDDTSAKATVSDGGTTITLKFIFNEAGLIGSVRADARGRAVSGAIVPTPWEGRWWDYELRDGMLIPTAGEVAWLLPDGPKPYWRGKLTTLTYEFTR